MQYKKIAVRGLAVCSMGLLNGCSWMGGSPMAGAVGHMVFGAVVALATVFIWGKVKK